VKTSTVVLDYITFVVHLLDDQYGAEVGQGTTSDAPEALDSNVYQKCLNAKLFDSSILRMRAHLINPVFKTVYECI